jgi:hypothetical protein
MRANVHLLSILVGLILTVAAASADTLTVVDVLASAAKYHGKTVQIRGVFWTDGEGSVLLPAPAGKLSLDRAIAVAGNWRELMKDENYQRLKADRQLFIQQTKEKDANARWVVFQAVVVLEGRFESAENLASRENTDTEPNRLLNPYRGCSWKLDLSRVVSYSRAEKEANKSPEATTLARTPAADAPVAPAVGRASS